MIRLTLVAVFFLTFFAVGEVRAEGGCPLGQYPVGGRGVVGCAPIPGAAASLQQQIPVPPAAPSGRWLKTWGAIAGDDGAVGAFGATSGQKSKATAESIAVERCTAGGGNGCATVFVYENQCAAMSQPVVGGSNVIIQFAGGRTLGEAESRAKTSCESRNSAECRIFYSACSEPFFISG